MINKILSSILLNTLVVYIILKYVSVKLGWNIPKLECEIVFLLGVIFWVVYDIVFKLIKFLALPFTLLFGGLFILILNIGIVYGYIFIVNSYN